MMAIKIVEFDEELFVDSVDFENLMKSISGI